MSLTLGNTKISVWHLMFVIFIFVKLVLDFLTPFREVAYALGNVFIYTFVFLYFSYARNVKITKMSLFELVALGIFVFSQILLQGDVAMLVKVSSLYVNFKILSLIFSSIDVEDIEKIGKKIITISIILFLVTFVYSLATGLISSRGFGYFEHVNLLGNVIVFLVLGVIYFNMSFKFKLAVFLMGLLSMSTGSLLISMLVFVPVRRINFKSVLIYALIGTGFLILFYIGLEKFLPDLHNKIFGIFSIFEKHSFSHFVYEVGNGTSIQKIDSEVKSSFVWRVYAWVKYYFAFESAHWANLLFGHGLMGYSEVWNGIMPHNDYILILYDFGIIFYLFLVPYFIKFIVVSFNNKVILFIGLLFLIRLGVENVIYSYYTFYIFILQFALVKNHYAKKKSLRNGNVPVK